MRGNNQMSYSKMQALKPLLDSMKKNKKGQLGLDLVKGVIIAFLVIIVLAVATIVAVVQLRDSGVLTANSVEANQTTNIVGNYTAGITSFFSNTTAIFSILFVVVIISAIAIVVLVVRRFEERGGGL